MEYELITETPIEGMEETSYIRATDNDGQVLIIPIDPGNRDYQAYLAEIEVSK